MAARKSKRKSKASAVPVVDGAEEKVETKVVEDMEGSKDEEMKEIVEDTGEGNENSDKEEEEERKKEAEAYDDAGGDDDGAETSVGGGEENGGERVQAEKEGYNRKPNTETVKVSTSLKQVLVGGPLLGRRPHDIPNFNCSRHATRNSISWDIFRPLITPEIVLEKRRKPERFILLPHDRFISVLAYQTGVRVATLLPTTEEEQAEHDDLYDRSDENDGGKEKGNKPRDNDDINEESGAHADTGPDIDSHHEIVSKVGDSANDESTSDCLRRMQNIIIESVTLAKYPRKFSERSVQDVLDTIVAIDDDDGDNVMERTLTGTRIVDEIVILVGCQDGTIREFSLKSLGGPCDVRNENSVGNYQVMGPCYRPRRVIRVLKKTESVMHLTVPHLQTRVQEDGILVYAVARTKGLKVNREEKKEKKVNAPQDETGVFVNIRVIGLRIPHFDGSTDVVLSNSDEDIDKISCKVGSIEKGKAFASTAPFQLLSVAVPGVRDASRPEHQQDFSIFLILARSNCISVYYHQLFQPSERFQPIYIQMPTNNPLTAIDISLNNADITCGHYRGNIQVMNNMLASIGNYHTEMSRAKQLVRGSSNAHIEMPQDPRKKMVTSRVHWHALPVTSLTYDSLSSPIDPLFYSGGEESVLVTWQVSQGKDRPADVLPRVALGGIIHMTCCDKIDDNPCNGILVFCEDNSLQLFESHNKGKQWKIQGLAAGLDGQTVQARGSCLEVDPRSTGQGKTQVVITGLSRAAGYVHWFDPARHQLASALEVAPFNRISRSEPDDRPLPSPSIIGHAFSSNGKDFVSIEETRTENVYVGANEKSGKKDEHGIVSTIRFWSWSDTSSITDRSSGIPYNQLASMTYPHGPKNRISAVGLRKDGSLACTVSADEKAFRIWKKILLPTGNGNPTESDPTTSWTCKYKATIPSGFSNFSATENGVSFSEDGSILAIAFGIMITLWDSEEVRLLTSFRCFDPHSNVAKAQFISPGKHRDLILVQSQTSVSLRSPYGPDGTSANFRAWTFALTKNEMMHSMITSTTLVESHSCIAVSIFSPYQNRSRVVFIDTVSGNVGIPDKGKSPLSFIDGVDGCIIGLCAAGKWTPKSNWNDENGIETRTTLTLYGLTDAGNLLLFTEDSTKHTVPSEWKRLPIPAGPRLDIIGNTVDGRKRQRANDSFPPSLFSAESRSKKMALDIFGFAAGDESSARPATTELPSLSRNFVRSFVGRSLGRSNQLQ
jgi:hypothetical protein